MAVDLPLRLSTGKVFWLLGRWCGSRGLRYGKQQGTFFFLDSAPTNSYRVRRKQLVLYISFFDISLYRLPSESFIVLVLLEHIAIPHER
jgi:hypothetical protein